MTSHPDIVVVGSINQDYFAYVDDFPGAGATILANDGASGLGGKGANQAIAARLLGARVAFVGAVGGDAAGTGALAALEADGVDVTGIRILNATGTGAAYITVNGAGENTIIVHSGANARVSADDVLSLGASAVVLAQGELPGAAIDAAARAALATGARFVLNLAPVVEVDLDTLATADPLIVNEGEAAELLGDYSDDLAGDLAARFGISVVVTLGSRGAAVSTPGRSWIEPSPVPSAVVDTTGAGDAFVGALAAALAAGRDLAFAVRVGAAAGSHAVESAGTTTSYARGVSLDELAS
ncbi:ribokinase [Glaciihabitans arcticus]|uniref:Ribokinase n=1 Tax=Glaciihabitans arcticus TaxID=2668039 RepID=A0A4Q9GU45_9MICO|nr:ribokinase [Glaciihabitans arcticus]TBN57724.1 ribokinase [Glaciihabitans arcticus]